MGEFATIFPNIKFFQKKLPKYVAQLYGILYDKSVSVVIEPPLTQIASRRIDDEVIATALAKIFKVATPIAMLYITRDKQEKKQDLKMLNMIKLLYNPNSIHYLNNSHYFKNYDTEYYIKNYSHSRDKKVHSITQERTIWSTDLSLYRYGIIPKVRNYDFYGTTTDANETEIKELEAFFHGKIRPLPANVLLAAKLLYDEPELVDDDLFFDPKYHFYDNLGFKCINIHIALIASENEVLIQKYNKLMNADLKLLKLKK